MRIYVFRKGFFPLIFGLMMVLLVSGLYFDRVFYSEERWQAEMEKPGLKGKTIVIDPGHGGADPGAMVGKIKEADINMEISLNLKKRLEKEGVRVKLTREGDRGIVPENRMTYSERTEILNSRKAYANKERAHILLSIHVNSSTEPSAAGAIVFYSDEKSKDLAQAIQQRLNIFDAKKRTVKKGNFTIINRNKMPAVLIETGFITNKEDRKRLTEKPEEIAEQIYLGLLDYVNK